MRILELTAHVQTVSRRQTLDSPLGQTATAAAAYRSCSAIQCERTGKLYDFTRKGGLVASGMEAPDDAPSWAKDRAKLWNAAEMRERNGPRGPNAHAFRMNAVVAREFLYGFPAELSEAGRLRVAQTVARHMVERYGMAADYAIHAPGRDGDQRNFHCHMMVTSRRVEADGLTAKTREWDAQANGARHVKAWRAYLAKTLNEALAAEGQGGRVFVEHRSFKDRGSGQKATRHMGKHATHGPRKARRQAREAWHQATRTEQERRHDQDRTALQSRQEAARAAKARDTAERERQGVAAIRSDLARSQAEDRAPSGASRFVQIVTGQAGSQDQARADRAAQRIEAAEQRIAELRSGIEVERRALAADQAREAKGLTDRHQSEGQQLSRALDARLGADRVAEVQARRVAADQRERDRHHDHDQERERH